MRKFLAASYLVFLGVSFVAGWACWYERYPREAIAAPVAFAAGIGAMCLLRWSLEVLFGDQP